MAKKLPGQKLVKNMLALAEKIMRDEHPVVTKERNRT